MSQRRILILIDNIESDYQIEMISGVLRATRAANVNALIVAGGWLSTPDLSTRRNFVYDLIPEAQVDGILVLAGSLSNHAGVAAFRRWLERFGALPLVCIGLQIEGRPSVFVDNGVGMQAAVSHLIEKHGRRKIGFFRGPKASAEAEQRYLAYEAALRQRGLALDARLVCFAPTFGREDGHKCVAELFDQRGVDVSSLDAIACVNDDVALGALEALTSRGISVPAQIALVGFDDAPNARAANPPLTTVNQCVELQGYTAGRTLVEALESASPANSQRLDSREVIRGSCGCQVTYHSDSRKAETASRGVRSIALAFLGRQVALKAEMARAAAGRLGSQSGWEERLLQALSNDLQHADGSFRYALEEVARRAIAVGGDIDPCNDVLTEVRLQVIGLTGAQPELRPRVEDMFQEARLMLMQVALSAYRERDQAARNHIRQIASTCFEILGTGKSDALAAALSIHLPPLGIAACTITSLRSGAKPRLEVRARVGPDFAHTKAAALPLGSLGLEQSLLHRAAAVLMPLDFNQQPVGLAAFAWGAHNPLIYEQLREVLNVAVYASTRAEERTPESAAGSRGQS